MAKLRSADGLLATAVAATINELDLDDEDKAAAELAKHYAAAIDTDHCSECNADRSLDTLGPKLLACLEALGATPSARARLVKGGAANAGPNRLGTLREARRAN